jgi:hypothetical protein
MQAMRASKRGVCVCGGGGHESEGCDGGRPLTGEEAAFDAE